MGAQYAALSALRAWRIGFVFQSFFLLGGESAIDNVADGLLYRGTRPKERRRAAVEALERVGLGHRLDHRPGTLSGGERQRVAIARALIRAPRLLLCDEPTGNLDRSAADNVASVLLDLHRRQQTILVIVTHSPQLAERCPIRFELTDRTLKRIS